MRILLISPNHILKWNFCHQLFRNEFHKHMDVVYYGKGFINEGNPNIREIVKESGPFDLILTWSKKYCDLFEPMVDLKIPVVMVIPDYFPHAVSVENSFINKHHPIMVIVRSNLSIKLFKESQKRGSIPKDTQVRLLHYGICPTIFRPRFTERKIDICASMSEVRWAYKNRPAIKAACRSMSQYNVMTEKIFRFDYAKTLANSKIFVNSVSKDHVISPRYTEVMGSGCLLLTDESVDDMSFGLQHGKNCIIYDGTDDMKSKADYFLRHNEKRERIAREGYRLVQENYTNHHQVKKFMNFTKFLLT